MSRWRVKIVCWAATLVGLTMGPVFADQVPTHVNPVSSGIGVTLEVPPPRLNPGEELYNTLRYTDSQNYQTGNGDAWSGAAIFGQVLDLQAVDDYRAESDCCLDVVVRDYVSFLGIAPAGGSYVALYAESNCAPADSPSCEQDGAPTSVQNFSDTVFGLVGCRNSVRVAGSCCVPAGTWFIEIQPHDETSGGDWYYTIRNTNEVVGCESYGRDGGRAPGGYGTTTWTAFSALGFGAGTIAQAITAKCGPPQPRCVYQVTNVKNLRTPCGDAVCEDCPYSRGDLICGNECVDGSECQGRLKGFRACSTGTSCKITANLVGCEPPPPNCAACNLPFCECNQNSDCNPRYTCQTVRCRLLRICPDGNLCTGMCR